MADADAAITPSETRAKVEVLADLEGLVHQVVGPRDRQESVDVCWQTELMDEHDRKRPLWFPSELLAPAPDTDPDAWRRELRDRARGIDTPMRVALALNLLTEEGLPHFHRLIAVYLGNESIWSVWNNLWTAEEDRHGAILHDYMHLTDLVHAPELERMQFEYLKAGFQPAWDQDPYRVFVYTSLQERATQVSHANTGKLASVNEPVIGTVLANVASEEARHYAFYRRIFKEVLARDPDRGLISASLIMPAIDMPGITMPHFRDMADVIRRAGIYGPRDYLKIVQDLMAYWKIEAVQAVTDAGKKAQEKILAIPARLQRVADAMEARRTSKTFAFDVAFNREFAME